MTKLIWNNPVAKSINDLTEALGFDLETTNPMSIHIDAEGITYRRKEDTKYLRRRALSIPIIETTHDYRYDLPAPQTDREKAEEWIAAVDAEEAGYCAFGEYLEGPDVAKAAAAINEFLKDAEKAPEQGYRVGGVFVSNPRPYLSGGGDALAARINFAPPADHLAPVIDLASRRARTRIHPSPCTCKTDGTVA